MSTVAILLVLSPAVMAGYAYVLYPLILLLLPRRGAAPGVGADDTPLVTVVVPAYNEEAQIRGAIDALIAQDYPSDRRHILVLSDGSTDGTDAIVAEYATRGVELLRMPARGGKTAAENASIAHIRGTIVVNTDASIRLDPSALGRLVAPFRDPRVGVASSRDVSVAQRNDRANAAEGGYVGYEMWIRSLESRTGGIVGASGSGYAIRLDLHRFPVRKDLSRDFSAALTAHRHGYTAVSVDDALCYVPRTQSLRAEYRRKVRTISRGMETLIFNRQLLDPQQHGLFAWKLLSHKLGRWLVPILAVPALAGLFMLLPNPVAAALLAMAALAGLATAVAALWPREKPLPRLLSILAFATAANAAVVHAAWRVVHGHEDHLWEPTRRLPVGEAAEQAALAPEPAAVESGKRT